MYIKTNGDTMTMSESLVCKNYSDMRHFGKRFEKIRDNVYKCTTCDTIMVVKEPVLTLDDKGRLKMEVETNSLQKERGRDVMPAKNGTPLSSFKNDPDRYPPVSGEDKFA